jgi:hypothetical protein
MIEQPDLRPINSKEYVLYECYSRQWEEFGTLCRQTTKSGYVTDIASTPSIGAVLGFKPDGLHRIAALLHDRRYQRKGIMTGDDPIGAYEEFSPPLNRWVPTDRVFSREECDRHFLQDMLDAGESKARAQVMFYAVRFFGWMAWK